MNWKESFNKYFELLGESIDISEAQKDDAHKRYKAVAVWLGETASPLSQFSPEIYVHGSFSLGTVVRPIPRENEFDMDVAIELKLSETEVDQAEIKRIVGERLKSSVTYKQMLTEMNRCWRLQYADGAQFHMDIVPGIPEQARRILAEQSGLEFGINSVLIPDKQLKAWVVTNPKGYLDWFKSKMRLILAEQRAQLAAKLGVDISEVPEYKVVTPLQRSIQILKRHRDIMFGEDKVKPISIIITTLAADHYRGQVDVVGTLEAIIRAISDDSRLVTGDIRNPVDERENFADKWSSHPERQEAFTSWIAQAGKDLSTLSKGGDLDELVESAGQKFGRRAAQEAGTFVAAKMGVSSAAVNIIERMPPRVEIREARPWHQ